RLPESLRRRLALGDGGPDARHRARAAGRRRVARPGAPVLRGPLRRLDPAGAAAAWLHAAGVDRAVHRRAAGPRAGRRARHPLDAPEARAAAARRRGDERAHPPRAGAGAVSFTTGAIVAALVLGLPALLFALWPLRRARGAAALLPLPPDARERLAEDKRAALRALRELEFEHASGHVSDADYADLRARYEAETAAILSELDRLGAPKAAPVPAPPAAAPAPPSTAWRHPAAIAVGAVALVTFGVGL